LSKNAITASAILLEVLSDEELLTYFNLTYKQTQSWQLCQPQKELSSKVKWYWCSSRRHCSRSMPIAHGSSPDTLENMGPILPIHPDQPGTQSILRPHVGPPPVRPALARWSNCTQWEAGLHLNSGWGPVGGLQMCVVVCWLSHQFLPNCLFVAWVPLGAGRIGLHCQICLVL
jgi:hypothetical protein